MYIYGKFRVNMRNFALIRESYAFIRESFALIRESYAFIRESYAFIRESFALIRESDAFICESFALIREKKIPYENELNGLSYKDTFLISYKNVQCVF